MHLAASGMSGGCAILLTHFSRVEKGPEHCLPLAVMWDAECKETMARPEIYIRIRELRSRRPAIGLHSLRRTSFGSARFVVERDSPRSTADLALRSKHLFPQPNEQFCS